MRTCVGPLGTFFYMEGELYLLRPRQQDINRCDLSKHILREKQAVTQFLLYMYNRLRRCWVLSTGWSSNQLTPPQSLWAQKQASFIHSFDGVPIKISFLIAHLFNMQSKKFWYQNQQKVWTASNKKLSLVSFAPILAMRTIKWSFDEDTHCFYILQVLCLSHATSSKTAGQVRCLKLYTFFFPDMITSN